MVYYYFCIWDTIHLRSSSSRTVFYYQRNFLTRDLCLALLLPLSYSYTFLIHLRECCLHEGHTQEPLLSPGTKHNNSLGIYSTAAPFPNETSFSGLSSSKKKNLYRLRKPILLTGEMLHLSQRTFINVTKLLFW